jgi:hypothetical protein
MRRETREFEKNAREGRERRGGKGRKKVGGGVSKKRMKLGACGRRKGRL